MTKIVDYNSPPLEEVVFGISFDRVKNFPVASYGKYWSTIADRFPKTADRSPLISDDSDFSLDQPLIRTWFVSDNEQKLIQLQQDRFIFNWRRVNSDWRTYPEYQNIFPEFWELFADFSRFVEQEPLKTKLAISQLELTYVNTVPFDSVSSHVNHLSEILVDHCYRNDRERFLARPTDFNWVSIYPMESGLGELKISATTAYRADNPKDSALRLSLTCSGSINPHESNPFRSWFDTAHDYIVRGFADATNREIQEKIWGRK